MDVNELAVLFNQGYDCAQCIVKAFEDRLGNDYANVIKSVSCMGMGLFHGSTCGAILGAMAVIGYKFGSAESDFGVKGICMIKREQFFMEFEKKYKGTTCPELMGLDIRNNDDNNKAYEQGVYTEKCPKMCCEVIEIVERMIS